MQQPKSYYDLVKELGIRIEAGKCYRTRSGEKVGPLKKERSWFVCDGLGFNPDGTRMSGITSGDLIAEWTEDQHEGTVSLDNHALPDAIIPTMSPAEALQELDLREREDDPMHGLSVDGFVDAYKSATDTLPLRVQILNAGASLTNGQRDREYGPPAVNMAASGALKAAFRQHLTRDIDLAELEAIDMCLTKLGRIATGTPKQDTYIDAATYIAIAGEIALSPVIEETLI